MGWGKGGNSFPTPDKSHIAGVDTHIASVGNSLPGVQPTGTPLSPIASPKGGEHASISAIAKFKNLGRV